MRRFPNYSGDLVVYYGYHLAGPHRVDMARPRHQKPTPKIALFTGAYNHIADGVSLTLNRLVGYLEKNGVEVLVFAPTSSTPAIEHAGTLEAVKSIALPGRPDYRMSLGLTPAIKRKLSRFKPNIIHIATPDMLGFAAQKYGKKNNIPVVSSYHTHFSSYLQYYKMGFMEGNLWRYLRWFYKNCDQIYVPSPSMADVLRSHGITDGLVHWPRGVDTSRFSPTHRSMEWRRKHGMQDDEIVVSFISRLVTEKGLDIFAQTLRRLEEDRIPFATLIVGEGPARSALEAALPKGHFVGHLQGDDLSRAYASSDIFLFPSQTETFGNVTLEAMASGVPAVCADATGSNALVVDGVTGYLAPPTSVPEFVRATRELIVNNAIREQMRIAARQRALEFDWDTILGRMITYYGEVLRDPVVAPPFVKAHQSKSLVN